MRTLPWPRLRQGQAIVRVDCCTLCASDGHTVAGRRDAMLPTILGHEVLGTIIELSDEDPPTDVYGKPLAVGDRVTWAVEVTCGQCHFCTNDFPQKCMGSVKYGHRPLDERSLPLGGLADHCLILEGTAIFPIPHSLSDYVATPSSCATATAQAAVRASALREGMIVSIQGAGMLGVTACAIASRLGARVILSDVDERRLSLAKDFGAERVVALDSDREWAECSVCDALEDMGIPFGADVVLEMSGQVESIESAFDILATDGRLVLVGTVFPTPAVALNPETVVRRRWHIDGVYNYRPQDLEDALAFLDETKEIYPFESLVGSSFSLDRVEDAFAYASEWGAMRVAVHP